jgi:hypothetical protein
MAPLHSKRKFWWELIFISVLLFLLAGVRPQREREVGAAQSVLAPAIVTLVPTVVAVVTPPPLPLPLTLN